MKNKCIEFKNSTDTQELYFYGDIVNDQWSKWTDTDTCPEDIQNLLSQLDENKPLNMYINSGGGNVFAGLAIFNMLKRSKCYKTAYIDGLAGSISSVIPMCADKIIIPSNAFLMVHKPICGGFGNSIYMRSLADNLDRLEQGLLNAYSEKLAENVDIETIKQLINNDNGEGSWLVGTEASKYFNVEVIQSNKAVASISNLERYNNVPDALKNKTKDKVEDSPDDSPDDSELKLLKAKLELELI